MQKILRPWLGIAIVAILLAAPRWPTQNAKSFCGSKLTQHSMGSAPTTASQTYSAASGFPIKLAYARHSG